MDSVDAVREWFDLLEDDKPHDECGAFGVYAPGREVARLTFFGLFALQHRGQESAGILTSDGRTAYSHKNMGLVSQVFNEQNLLPLRGHLAIGHTRYSTTGSSELRNAQPYLIETIYGPLGVAHNGNLTNALTLRRQLLERGVGLSSTADTELITQILASPPGVWGQEHHHNGLANGNGHINANGHSNGNLNGNGYGDAYGAMVKGNGAATETAVMTKTDHWIDSIKTLMDIAEGAYSLTILTRDAVYAVRDPLGLRPLCLGKLETGYVVASESCAFGTIGAEYIREIEPGEIVRLDENGLASFQGKRAEKRAMCVFEHVYFSRPDSILDGQVVHQVRQRLGRQLAIESPVEADIVVGVPDSATPHAIGYSLESGLPFTEGLIKNRYIGRTFIQPDDRLRKQGIHLKYNALSSNLKGKRVVLIDDSIVRGNTSGPLIQLLRDAGAVEVHVRVASPPIKHPCFMGVDMATHSELIANKLSLEEIRQKINATSLAYLSLEGMLDAIGTENDATHGHCTACFSGKYPIRIPHWLYSHERDKMIFEGVWRES